MTARPAISTRARSVIDRVLAILETGADPGAGAAAIAPYAAIGDRRDGAGLTGGKHQATDRAGSLYAIIEAYIDNNSAGPVADAMASAGYLPWLRRNGSIGDGTGPGSLEAGDAAMALGFVSHFQAAATDPVMRLSQDWVFDKVYWKPAVEAAANLDLRTALAHLVIYDTSIHSGGDGKTTKNTTDDAVEKIRPRFAEGPPSVYGGATLGRQEHRDIEAAWVAAYVKARGKWLRGAFVKGSPGYVSAFRCDALARFVSAGNWRLQTPLEVVLPHKVVRVA